MKFVCSLFRVPVDHHVQVARAAEEAGFEAVALSDRIAHVESVSTKFPYTEDGSRPWLAEDEFPDVWVATAMMAAVTTRLRFLQAVYVLPARDPFSVARSLGTLARMSNHRVSLGFGVGWMREEFDLMGRNFERRGARSDEMIELMRKLWTGESVDHRGEFFDIEGIRMRPAVKEPIPILCSGESEAALRRAARLAGGWIPPISMVTPEDLLAPLETLRAYRREAGRAGEPFDVYWTPLAGWRDEESSALEALGVSHVFASPWAFDEVGSLDLEQRCAAIEDFGRTIIRSANADSR
ncbi:MAG: TIGR03619 family F420-dependent LLM class oxidoreductase [bacterium]|nr:LLM class F420-dependent oxidoreductase [Deltaproteobacteria bacterium]MCP4905884.1 TIGR03619 family F420-dependent LLM class oxidoreductase [bacterium]